MRHNNLTCSARLVDTPAEHTYTEAEMAKPYIQFTLHAIDMVPILARSTGASFEIIFTGLGMMWQHCYRQKVNVIRVPELRGFFGPVAGIADALVAHGFLEDLGDRMRVKGMDRYSRLSETRADAGRKGGKATQTRATPKRTPEGRFAGVSTEATPKQLLPSDTPAEQALGTSVAPSVKRRETASDAGATVDHGSKTEAIASVDRSKTEATRKQQPKQTDDPPKQTQALYQRSESLSPSERETLLNGSPAQRESHAPPPKGAGRDSRTATSEGTRGETPAVPASPPPAPRPQRPKPEPRPYVPPPPDPDPIEIRRWLWGADEMPRQAPTDDEWVNAVVWRLKRLTMVPDAVVRRSQWPAMQENIEASFVVAAEEAAGMVPGIAGRVLLSELDDREKAIDGAFAVDLVRWLREHAERLEPMAERERIFVDQGEEEAELVH